MATLTGGANGVDMRGEPFYDPLTSGGANPVTSVVSSSTAIQITLQNTDTELVRLSGGTVTGFERDYTVTSTTVYNGGGYYGSYSTPVTAGVTVPTFTITGTSTPLSQVNAAINANNGTTILKDLLTGHDTYVGTAATDYLIGQGGNDTFIGGSGTETFVPAAGANTITGGSGFDTVIFQGPRSAYTIVANGDGSITVTDSIASRNGTDHIANVANLQFSDTTALMANSGGGAVALLYSAALARAPDAAGLQFWENLYYADVSAAAKAAGTAVSLGQNAVPGAASIADGFIASNEFQAKYGNLSDIAFITQLYANVLNRAPDPAGLAFWEGQISSGATHAVVLVGFAESNENIANAVAAGWLIAT